jgi:putative transposase
MTKIRPSEQKIKRNDSILMGKELAGFEDLVLRIAEGIIQNGL